MGYAASCSFLKGDGRCLGYPTQVVAACVVGVGGVFFLLYKLWCCLERRGRSEGPVLTSADICANQPKLAVEKAKAHIERGEILTLGQLVYFFRGGEEKTIRINGKLFEYLRKDTFCSGGAEGQVSRMMQQLCHCEEQAARLEYERATAFDDSNPQHLALLERLWVAGGKSKAAYVRRTPEWNDFGFQGKDPATDLRGGGVLALRQFVHFAEEHTEHLKDMMEFNRRVLLEGGNHWYLLAVVSIQFSAQLLLQRDYKMFLPQLEILYDTVVRTGDPELKPLGGRLRSTAARRRVGAEMGSMASRNRDDCWDGGETSDFEAGYFALHHQLMLRFKECWHRDCPHVMEYSNYMSGFFRDFFSSE